MDRPPLPLPLPLPRPGEAIVTTAIAGALGLTTWACVPFVAFAARLVPFVALVVTPIAFHWLRRGLMTEENSPERVFTLPSSSTAVRIGFHAFAFAPLVASGAFGLAAALLGQGANPLAILFGMVLVATFGVVVWGPVTLAAVVAYGLPLRDATAAMDATYPDVVDRGLVRTHRRLAAAAVLAVVLAATLRGVLGAEVASSAFARGMETDLAIELPSVAVFVLLAAAAIGVPGRAALRAHRRLAARTARIGSDLHLVPLPPGKRVRRHQLPVLGAATRPTHALVRVAAVGTYRVAETAEEPVALVAVAEDARPTDTSAKDR